jgi:hypothetical protein
MMLTDLSQVGDHLREWYSKSKPEEFADYVIAKDNTFQFLIKEYVMFDEDTDFAHAVSHWFVNSMGLRKAR